MKTIGMLFAVAVLVAGCSAPTPADQRVAALIQELQIYPLRGKDVAPDFTLDALDGSRLALRDLRGQPVLLYFWVTT